MKPALVFLVGLVASWSVVVAGCAQPAPSPTATKAPAAAPKPAEPTKSVEPTKVTAVQPTAAPATKVDFPQKGKAITVIVNWGAGGATDIGARQMAAQMEKTLGTSVEIVNKVGAGGQVGQAELVLAKPDGYTIGNTNMPATATVYLDPERQATFNRKSFQPIANYVSDPMVLVAKGHGGRYKSLKDLIDDARARPGRVTVAHVGWVGPTHIPIVMLEKMAGVKFAITQMATATEIQTGLLGDHIDAGVSSAANYPSLFKGGDLVFLAMFDPQESDFWPGAKTAEEQGYKIYFTSNHGFSGPAGIPKETVSILSGAMKKATENSEFINKMKELAFPVHFIDTPEYEAYWDKLEAEIAPLVKELREEQKKQ